MSKVFLYPGKIAASKDPCEITTLLGSCVAVALYDPSSKIGGLNHYLLPAPLMGDAPNTRYGSFAIPALIQALLDLGARRDQLQAKIYGGGNVISDIKSGDIGKRNIELAKKILEEEKISILHQDVGGERGRKIVLSTQSFDVKHQFNKGDDTDSDTSGYAKVSLIKTCKVMIVDDSATVRSLFHKVFTQNGLEVVGVAVDPYDAREKIVTLKPDVITLDIEMPKMSGVAFLEALMKAQPMPVVMVSSLGSQGEAALRSLELGAIEFVHKPSQFDPMVLKQLAEVLVGKVRAAASVNVLARRKQIQSVIQQTATVPSEGRGKGVDVKVVVIGGNAGSPNSVEKLLPTLDSDTPPVVVCCSTLSGFVEAFIAKIKSRCKVSLKAANSGDVLHMGEVYFAPAGAHTKVQMTAAGHLTLSIEKGMPVGSQIPSATILFQSAVKAVGGNVYGILLGGFGSDGVDGLQTIQAKGGVTVVENPDSAGFPYGPQKAIEIGVADHVFNLNEMSPHLMKTRNLAVLGR